MSWAEEKTLEKIVSGYNNFIPRNRYKKVSKNICVIDNSQTFYSSNVNFTPIVVDEHLVYELTKPVFLSGASFSSSWSVSNSVSAIYASIDVKIRFILDNLEIVFGTIENYEKLSVPWTKTVKMNVDTEKPEISNGINVDKNVFRIFDGDQEFSGYMKTNNIKIFMSANIPRLVLASYGNINDYRISRFISNITFDILEEDPITGVE